MSSKQTFTLKTGFTTKQSPRHAVRKLQLPLLQDHATHTVCADSLYCI